MFSHRLMWKRILTLCIILFFQTMCRFALASTDQTETALDGKMGILACTSTVYTSTTGETTQIMPASGLADNYSMDDSGKMAYSNSVQSTDESGQFIVQTDVTDRGTTLRMNDPVMCRGAPDYSARLVAIAGYDAKAQYSDANETANANAIGVMEYPLKTFNLSLNGLTSTACEADLGFTVETSKGTTITTPMLRI